MIKKALIVLIFWITYAIFMSIHDMKPSLIFLSLSLFTMIFLWTIEEIPQWLPSLIPLFTLVPFGHLSLSKTLNHYFSPTTFLFFGGMVLSKLIEHHKLHEWFFFRFIVVFEKSKYLFLMGVLLISIFLSSFISNTATALLMYPLIIQSRSPSLMLAMGYGASLGGLATIIGSPVNAIFVNFWNNHSSINLHFFQWIELTAPLVIFGFFILFISLSIGLDKETGMRIHFENKTILQLQPKHYLVLTFFFLFIIGWILSPFVFFIPNEAYWSLILASLIILLPFKFNRERFFPITLLKDLNYSILLLFGAGLAFADALGSSGMIEYLTQFLSGVSELSLELKLFSIITLMILFTEISSNTAAVSIFIPLFFGLHEKLNLPLFQTLIAVTAASSLSFMLPTATPPNAIVFSSKIIKLNKMIKLGFILNILFAFTITFWALKTKMPH